MRITIDLPEYAQLELRVHERCIHLMRKHPGRFTDRLDRRARLAAGIVTAAVKVQYKEQTR